MQNPWPRSSNPTSSVHDSTWKGLRKKIVDAGSRDARISAPGPLLVFMTTHATESERKETSGLLIMVSEKCMRGGVSHFSAERGPNFVASQMCAPV